MSVESRLRPFMRQTFDHDSAIGNHNAVKAIRQFVREQPDANDWDDEARAIGYLFIWRRFVRQMNARARKQMKDGAVGTLPTGQMPLDIWGALQLPLPDGQTKVTIGRSRVSDLRHSAQLLVGQLRGMYATIRQISTAADLLEVACAQAGNPDLELEDAIDMGLIDIQRIAAA